MLLCKNVTVNGRRTSMRFDADTWMSIHDICYRQRMTVKELCSRIDRMRGKEGLSLAVRVFVLNYFRAAVNRYEGDLMHISEEYNPKKILGG